MTHLLAALNQAHVVQAIIIGGVFAFLTATLLMKWAFKRATTTINGWSTTTKCGKPGNGILLRAAYARTLPAVNVDEEATYWTTTLDSNGKKLTGRHNYRLLFDPGQLPPNEAFWSLTLTDVAGFMVSNPIERYSLGDRSGLEPNADGSVKIYLQNKPPTGHDANWLPTPHGDFKLMLRVYLPGPPILEGAYHLPQVTKADQNE